ncbi:MAG TPA: hypothetical protein VEZ88_08705 [Steroidobacteraceae bacterium]|nr:hypothetical protein [Steroidobacteraceae bacterium]
MAMQAATLEILEKADLPPRQARAIAQAIELEVAAGHSSLATRQDLLVVKHELQHEMGTVRQDLQLVKQDLQLMKQDLQLMKQELRTEIAESKSEVVRWVFLCILGQSAMLLGIGYFLFSHVTA